MKKAIFILLLLLISYFTGYSQSIKFGIKAGLNYANFTGSDIKTDAITSYHGGLVTQISVTKKFALQPELLYTTQGATYKTATQDFKNELGYITIPVMLKFNISDSLLLELGPQAGFLLNEKNKFNVLKSNTFDFMANAGLGLKITETFFAQARYGLGLTEIKTDSQIKNSVIQLSVGLFL